MEQVIVPTQTGEKRRIEYRVAIEKAILEEKSDNDNVLSYYWANLEEGYYPGWSVEQDPFLARMAEIGTGRSYVIPLGRFNKAAPKLLVRIIKWRMFIKASGEKLLRSGWLSCRLVNELYITMPARSLHIDSCCRWLFGVVVVLAGFVFAHNLFT
jgi:hypothetical protein